MSTIYQSAPQHFSMVLDLALERAICNHTTFRQIDMQALLRMEVEIAFDELKTENHWAWNDMQELREANHCALGEYEEKALRGLRRKIKRDSKGSQ